MDTEREKLWEVVDRLRARNLDKTEEEVERDVAEAIAEDRAERRAAEQRARDATPAQR